jgi:hypothetical protein
MSGGEFIPNGSVHWDIEEEEVKDNGGNIDRKKVRPNLRGRDPIDPTLIGKGKKDGKHHPDTLRVILRFKTRAQAEQALAAVAAPKENGASHLWEVEIRVPVSTADSAQADQASPNPWAQARVEW